jgi:hypothetical protein
VDPCPASAVCGVSGLGWPVPWPWQLQSTWSLSCWLHLLPVVFLGKRSMFLASPTSWGFHYTLSITLTAPHITHLLRVYLYGLLSCQTLLGFLNFPAKSGWKPPWPHNSYILHAWKTSITWTMPRSVTSLSSKLGHLGPWLHWPLSAWGAKHGEINSGEMIF